MYLYETHCHTAPVSKCGKASAEDTVRFYKKMGYDGLFITNHFLDGNINLEVWNWPYAEQIDYYSDYEKAAEIGKEVGIKVFPGVELSYKGTDFLIYGLGKDWYNEIVMVEDYIEQVRAGTMEMFLMNEKGNVQIIRPGEAII